MALVYPFLVYHWRGGITVAKTSLRYLQCLSSSKRLAVTGAWDSTNGYWLGTIYVKFYDSTRIGFLYSLLIFWYILGLIIGCILTNMDGMYTSQSRWLYYDFKFECPVQKHRQCFT
ncbi:unnamed protein product [Citrullus colocynthis]|uniref:Uncharacterized protein n=1 Tax=Citrullus colocynthis TaxID=252529 RepID=A0ABP0YFG0_9ROSI